LLGIKAIVIRGAEITRGEFIRSLRVGTERTGGGGEERRGGEEEERRIDGALYRIMDRDGIID